MFYKKNLPILLPDTGGIEYVFFPFDPMMGKQSWITTVSFKKKKKISP
jgi:hypothetical protein